MEDLSESEQKYKMLIDNQGEGIGLINRDLKFTFANPRAEEILLTRQGKLINKEVCFC